MMNVLMGNQSITILKIVANELQELFWYLLDFMKAVQLGLRIDNFFHESWYSSLFCINYVKNTKLTKIPKKNAIFICQIR